MDGQETASSTLLLSKETDYSIPTQQLDLSRNDMTIDREMGPYLVCLTVILYEIRNLKTVLSLFGGR